MFTNRFGDLLTKLGVSRRFQSGIYPVFHEESESEVQNAQILPGIIKNNRFIISKKNIWLNPISGLSYVEAAGRVLLTGRRTDKQTDRSVDHLPG